MSRFKIDVRTFEPRPEESAEYSSDDDSGTEDDELVYSSDEEEEPHPLGFAGCRYTASEEMLNHETMEMYKRRMGYLHPFDEDCDMLTVEDYTPTQQQWPPLYSYIDASATPTKDLIQYSYSLAREADENQVDMIAHLLEAACIIEKPSPSIHRNVPLQVITRPYQLILADEARIKMEMDKEKAKIAKDHQEAVHALRMLLEQNKAAADNIRKKQARIDAEAREKEEEEQRQQDAKRKEEEIVRSKLEKEEEEKQQEQQRTAQVSAAKQKADEDAIAKETEYLRRADHLIAQLKLVRASVIPFDESKSAFVKKRRLQMKKMVGGKVNTLAENAEKIKSVASDVSQAIAAAREEDEVIKQQLTAGNNEFSREMALGKRYLVDLLCSKVMVRVQSEGFNGQRGDGFPLANMLAIAATEQKDIGTVLAAHIYSECPTAIPLLPSIDANASEEEVMTSLGMKQNADGTSETFKRFLDRTESIISLVADIMSSQPSNHTLLGGHEAAVQWLKRFLHCLPDAPVAPLPLLTAPVLDAFLTGAGHMMANLHEEAFQPLLHIICTDVINRLDDGAIGAPSATRLRQTVQGGLEGFKRNLPSKALPELYCGGEISGTQHCSVGSQLLASFGETKGEQPVGTPASNNKVTVNNPFGVTLAASQASKSSPFGMAAPSHFTKTSTGNASSPFSNSQPVNTGMGMSLQAVNPNSPFGAAPSSFAQSGSTNPAGFRSSPFGTNSNQQANNTPFTAMNPASTAGTFGIQTNENNTNVFGSGSSGQQAMSTPFAQSGSGNTSTPFGSSPFVSNQSQSPSPFGAPVSTQSNPSNTPFGGPVNTPFGGASNTALGGAMNTPFGGSSNTNTPFGGSSNTSTLFGGSSTTSTPFGGLSASTFGRNTNSSFGNSGGGSGGFGSGFQQPGASGQSRSKKGPCRYFAQGRCRFGESCLFSHDISSGGQAGFGSGSVSAGGTFAGASSQNSPFVSNPFGGPRR